MAGEPNIWLGFVEGIALVVSPCILPVLPLILSGSLIGSRKRPFGIILGFVIFFGLFTFFSRLVVQFSGLNPALIRAVSYFLLIIIGVIMMSGYLTEKFMLLTARLMRAGAGWSRATDPQAGFWGHFIRRGHGYSLDTLRRAHSCGCDCADIIAVCDQSPSVYRSHFATAGG